MNIFEKWLFTIRYRLTLLALHDAELVGHRNEARRLAHMEVQMRAELESL